MIHITDGTILNKTEHGDRWQAVLVSDEEPENLELSGVDVEGMNNSDILAVGSVLVTPSKDYIAMEDGVFTQKG